MYVFIRSENSGFVKQMHRRSVVNLRQLLPIREGMRDNAHLRLDVLQRRIRIRHQHVVIVVRCVDDLHHRLVHRAQGGEVADYLHLPVQQCVHCTGLGRSNLRWWIEQGYFHRNKIVEAICTLVFCSHLPIRAVISTLSPLSP